MELNYPTMCSWGADNYIIDGETNHFQEFMEEYESNHSVFEYEDGELLEEAKIEFLYQTLEIIEADLKITLKQITERK